jgi:hypothetical protein
VDSPPPFQLGAVLNLFNKEKCFDFILPQNLIASELMVELAALNPPAPEGENKADKLLHGSKLNK